MPRNQARHSAAISLGIMGAGFIGTFPLLGYGAGALLHGGFEAGLVGGLADWFAVTALFRHPLGIKIPHTALLPRNRDKVIRSLVNVIENEFLTKESIKSKVGAFLAGDKLLSLAERHADDAVRAIVSVSEYAARHLPIDRIVPILAEQLKLKAKDLDSSAVLTVLRDEVLERGYEEQALHFLLRKAEGILVRDAARDQLGAMAANALSGIKAGGLMGFAVNAFAGFMSEDKLGVLLQNAILSSLREMRQYENHPLRMLLLDEIRRILIELPNQAGVAEGLDAAKLSMLNGWDLEGYLRKWLGELRERAIAFVQEERYATEIVAPAVNGFLARFREEPERLDGILGWVEDRISGLVDENHSRIGALVRENLDKLDNKTLIEMIEDKVGSDLQWIRVNGAVCGFLIGLLLEGVNLIF
ncbi:DUF445 domain-containing protein [Cohnella sp. AR92]|uniref:DUF445 domain-containing protein n=1 Tax=Cohnella sp. AR92 TaxID=648716 RepID=UPI000F8E47D1|nr:DUF445 domain-containing protein [Cohnella sp. AR92]RUS46788.1 DUF445 domain-containing protein [Cohnella sp. AR92]